MEYKHKGVTITFDPAHAEFKAVIGSIRKTTTSLAGMKKAIDSATEFKGFTALKEGYRGEKPKVVKVVGIQKGLGRFGTDEWILEDKGTARSLLENTPANVKALEAWQKADAAEREREQKAKEAIGNLRQKIKIVRPE